MFFLRQVQLDPMISYDIIWHHLTLFHDDFMIYELPLDFQKTNQPPIEVMTSNTAPQLLYSGAVAVRFLGVKGVVYIYI